MKNYYQRHYGEEEPNIQDPLAEADLAAYQRRLEQQANGLEEVGRSRAQQRSRQQAHTQGQRVHRQQETREQTGRYSRGYYDGYADAIDELNERLAEEDDDYDFGRHYRGKPSAPKKRRKVVYEYPAEERVVVRRKRKRRGHPLLVVLIILIVLIVLAAFAASRFLFRNVSHVEPVADAAADAHAQGAGVSLYKDPSVKNILLIGSDQRVSEEERQRSDTMIICSINTRTKSITLTSLMRDMYLPIPDYGYNKLNAAYALGDMELLDETVQENFGIDINGNALVDFDGFLQALTAVGNIEMELTQEEADYMNSGGWEDQGTGVNDGTWNLHAGVNSLTPAQALAYCRIRYVGNSDWERTERQRKVVMAALAQFRRSDPLTQARVMSEAMANVTTDMSDRTLLTSMFRALVAGGSNVQNYLIPVDGAYYIDNIDGMDVLVPDIAQNSIYLKEYIYG